MGYKLPFWFLQLTLFNCCSISLFWLHHICPYSQRTHRQHISHCNRGIPMWKEGVFLLRPCAYVHPSAERSWLEKRGHGAIVLHSRNKKFASQPERGGGQVLCGESWRVSPWKLSLLRQAEQRDGKHKPGNDTEHSTRKERIVLRFKHLMDERSGHQSALTISSLSSQYRVRTSVLAQSC